ncbi:tripartite tricarboxylate transporter permease [Brevibacillus choshinensis]|uniref:tripartite tricarboxylate transporter permease n=1 Tax=Brevibacillus choshinensis TaxID=54911 RepID=UPI002E1CF594|nr:tripartite tricarboxylate transporter permease [Brevibacillus choshinensis]
MSPLLEVIGELFTWNTLLLFLVGTIIGIIIGALPGFTTTMGVSLLISFTWGMPLAEALVLIVSLHIGGTYGGSTSAIFLNIPGTPASAATSLDGYPMALRGEGGLARGIATIQSFIGSILAAFLFLLATPLLSQFSMNFGSWEYFLLALFGILISANITAESLTKGIIAGIIGLILATVGMDLITGTPRFTFGRSELMDGFSLISVLIGLFGLSEVITALSDLTPPLKAGKVSSVMPSMKMLKKFFPLGIRSSFIGALIGAVPGVGADVASWVSYDMAKRRSKEPETFGKGNPEGIVASETANNACVPGSYIPMLTLGIPGDSVTAVIIGGLMLHGLNPGPLLLTEQPFLLYQIFLIILVASFFMLLAGLSFSSIFQRVLLLPKSMVLLLVSVLCVIGTYAVNSRPFDIGIMFLFGLIGYGMKQIGLPAPPMVLGIILGPMAEQNFRRAMVSADYSFLPFITRPICIILILTILFIVIGKNQAVIQKWHYIRKKICRSRRIE